MKPREFLFLRGLVAGSCLIPAQAARLIRETGILAREPFILPRNPSSTLHAMPIDGPTDVALYLGDPFEEQKTPNWREYFNEYEGIDVDNKQQVEEWWREQVGDPDDEPITIVAEEEIDGTALEKWEWHQELHEGPSARAYRHLIELPLDDGRGEKSGDSLGDLRFIEGERPGSNLIYVEAPDLGTLACVQTRLNELGEDLAIEIRKW